MKIIKSKKIFNKIKLSDILTIKNGFAFKNPNLKGGVKWLTIKNIQNGKIDWDSTSYLPESYLEEYSDFVLKENDLVMALTRPITNDLLKISKVDVFSDNSLLNQRNAKITPKENCDPLFLYQLFLSYKMKNEVAKALQGSDPPNVSSKQIENIEFNIPDNIFEQNNIARVLSQQEDQVTNIKSLIEKLEKRNQYYAERLLSGELRVREGDDGNVEFYENESWINIKLNHYLKKEDFRMPSDWTRKLVNTETLLTKGTSVNAALFNFEGEGLQFLRTGDIWEEALSSKEPAYYNGEIDEKFIKKPEDYMSVFEGYNTKIRKGTIGLVTNNLEGIVSSHLYKTENKKINGKYYSVALLKLNYIQNLILRQGVGTTVLSATKAIKTLEYIYPTDKKEKMLIEKVLSGLYFEVEKLKKVYPKEQKRFDWMSDALLSGEYQIVD